MTGRSVSAQHGFTFLELVVSLAIGVMGIGASMGMLSVSDGLVSDSRRHLEATAEYREAHAAIAAELRNADVDTLTGFDADGIAYEPGFMHVTGIVSDAIVHSAKLQVRYVSYPKRIKGVFQLGDVEVGDLVLTSGGSVERILVPMLLKDAFEVRQEGRSLIIRLAVLSGDNPQSMILKSGVTVVALRN